MKLVIRCGRCSRMTIFQRCSLPLILVIFSVLPGCRHPAAGPTTVVSKPAPLAKKPPSVRLTKSLSAPDEVGFTWVFQNSPVGPMVSLGMPRGMSTGSELDHLTSASIDLKKVPKSNKVDFKVVLETKGEHGSGTDTTSGQLTLKNPANFTKIKPFVTDETQISNNKIYLIDCEGTELDFEVHFGKMK